MASLSTNTMTVAEYKLKEYMDDRFEEMIQQQSAHHSDNLAQFKEMNSRLSETNNRLMILEKTIGDWKFGGRLAFWLFVAVGGIVTWLINLFGIKIGFKP